MFMSSACVKGCPNKIFGTPLTHLPHHNPHPPRTPSPQPSPTHLSSHLTTALTHPSLLPPHHNPHPPISAPTTALTHPSLLPPHHSPHPPISPAAQGQNQLGRYHLDGELKVKSDDERESRKKWVCCVRWCVLVSCPTIAGLPHGTSVVQSQRGGGRPVGGGGVGVGLDMRLV